jgi:integrase
MVAPSTARAYAADRRMFEAWRASHAESEPVTRDTLIRWGEYRAEHGAKWATIRRGLVSVAAAFQVPGLRPPQVRRIRRSVASRQRRQARPIRAAELAKLARACPDTFHGSRMRALLLVMWTGALRVSEAAAMRWRDLEWCEHGIALTIPRSKTDQYGDGAIVAIPVHAVAHLDPLRALQAWRVYCPPDADQVWVTQKGAPLRQLQAYVSAYVRARLGAGYSSHSMRAGWITEAAAAGITESAMMMQTRHRSAGVLVGYIREARLWDDNPAAQVARRLG